MLDDLLDHACDIFHLQTARDSPGYGLPGTPSFRYSAEPDIACVRCHFSQKGAGGTVNTIVHAEFNTEFNDRVKLTLPLGIDVRVNDRVRDRRTGLYYTAEAPKTIRGHHIYAIVRRDGLEAAL